MRPNHMPRGEGQNGIMTQDEAPGTHAELGELEPEDEDALEGEVPGEVVEDDAEGEGLEEVEEAEDDPVSKPLDVVGVTRRLEGLDGEEGGERPADEVGHGLREGVDAVEDGEEDDGAEEGVALGHLRALLEGVQDGVLGELAVAVV